MTTCLVYNTKNRLLSTVTVTITITHRCTQCMNAIISLRRMIFVLAQDKTNGNFKFKFIYDYDLNIKFKEHMSLMPDSQVHTSKMYYVFEYMVDLA